MQIQFYPDLLDIEQWKYVVDTTHNGSNWKFSGSSNNAEADELKFWFMDLSHDTFFTETMLEKIKQVTNRNFSLDRVYANGQTYGLSGNLHQDTIGGDGNYFTFLYYVGPFWNPTWGGNTVFHNPDNDTIYTQYPTPNGGLIFDSEIWHAGLEPTRHCKELRVTIAHKLKLEE